MIKRFLIVIILLLVLCNISIAQTSSSTAYRFRKGGSLPSTCAVGDVFYRTADSTFYGCDAANTWTEFGGGGGEGGNPTVLVGLTPINGVATTYIRSDGAPALDQSIAPTWTGIHTFQSGKLLATSPVFTTNIVTPAITNAGSIAITTIASNGDLNITLNGSGNIIANRSLITSVAGQAYIAGTNNSDYVMGIIGGGSPMLRTHLGGMFCWSNDASNANNTLDTCLARNGAGIVEINNSTAGTFRDLKLRNLTYATAGTISITSGTNQRAGDATLVGGTVTVSNTTITANTRVYLQRKTAGGTLGAGGYTYTLSAGVSFTINSVDLGGVLSILDTSVVSYVLVEVP